MVRRNLKTGETTGIRPNAPKGEPPYRFNWNTPFILSHHNPHILYAAATTSSAPWSRATTCSIISPEITRTKRGTARPWPSRRRTPTCCGPAPTTAPCG